MAADSVDAHPKLDVIDRFLLAYVRRDLPAMACLATPAVYWRFPGPPPLGGVWRGIEGIVVLLDQVSALGLQETTLVCGDNDRCVVQCKQTRGPGDGARMLWCVLWSFQDGRISSVVHLTADTERLVDLLPIVDERASPVARPEHRSER